MLTTELTAFATMLGNRLNKFEEGPASYEIEEIAEYRLAELLGMSQDDESFQAIWSEVHSRACELIEDDPAGLLPADTPATEAELAGLPWRLWQIRDDTAGCAHEVAGRTVQEAIRRVNAAVGGGHSLTVHLRPLRANG